MFLDPGSQSRPAHVRGFRASTNTDDVSKFDADSQLLSATYASGSPPTCTGCCGQMKEPANNGWLTGGLSDVSRLYGQAALAKGDPSAPRARNFTRCNGGERVAVRAFRDGLDSSQVMPA